MKFILITHLHLYLANAVATADANITHTPKKFTVTARSYLIIMGASIAKEWIMPSTGLYPYSMVIV